LGCSAEGGVAEYNVGKGFRRFAATTALDDNSENSEATVQLEIFADGRPVFSDTIAYGKATPIELDLSGVLRLKFQWRPIQKSCERRTLVIGEATLFGLPGEVPTTTPTS
jgi:serine/threonine-protein kinase